MLQMCQRTVLTAIHEIPTKSAADAGAGLSARNFKLSAALHLQLYYQ